MHGLGVRPAVYWADEVIDDPGELLLEVEHVKRNAEHVGHAPGVGRVGGRATARFAARRKSASGVLPGKKAAGPAHAA